MAAINQRTWVGVAVLMGAAALVTACGHFPAMRWPWGHKAQSAPTAVNELVETDPSGNVASYPQYWKRNTLLLDLHAVAAEGSLVLTPRAGTVWPVRLAFRVTPGSIGVLEVRGEQRMILPVAQEGRTPVDLELVPGVYGATTAQITVRWSAR
jgi:hypothetical protein